MEKQLKYTDLKGIRYAAIVGLLENEDPNQVILKDLQSRTQETLNITDIVKKINQSQSVIPAQDDKKQ